MIRQAGIYGAVAGAVIFFVGWITGMGGGVVPNLIFGAGMGLFAAACYVVAVGIGKRAAEREDD